MKFPNHNGGCSHRRYRSQKEDHKQVFEEYFRNLDITSNTILSDKDFNDFVKFFNLEQSKCSWSWICKTENNSGEIGQPSQAYLFFLEQPHFETLGSQLGQKWHQMGQQKDWCSRGSTQVNTSYYFGQSSYLGRNKDTDGETRTRNLSIINRVL